MKMYLSRLLCVVAVSALSFACTTNQTSNAPAPSSGETNNNAVVNLKPALDSINADDLLRHTKELSSDAYEGRGPGTKGEALSVKYLTEQFQKSGLKPGNPDGTYVQKVPLVGITAEPRASVTAGGKALDWKFPDDYVAVSRRFVPETKIENSDLVFVGYGVVAPEYGWDDYKGVDVKGKTIVMLINDPAVPDPSATASIGEGAPAQAATETNTGVQRPTDPKAVASPAGAPATKLDDKMFKGKAMTYYGRWTYKYEIASEKGAAAAIIVHETGPAGYGYEVVKSSWGRENFDIQAPDKNMSRVGVEAWITTDKAKELFKAGGQDFDALKRAAVTKDFKPVTLNAKANLSVKNTLREINSQNVVARLDGSDPKLKDEYIVYSAHWDHLGRDEKLTGDQIFNGALDNASGTAALLEIAEAFTKLPVAPKRTMVFLAVTAEEKGLLGAKYYGTNPLYPLARTLANINMDGVNQWGRTKDIVIVGDGNTTLDDLLREEATKQGRAVKPDPESDKGFYYRSDHFEFARQGVPALYPDSGTEYVGKPADYSEQKRNEYVERDYHKVSDEVKPDWDLAGAVEDAQLLVSIGHRVAQADQYPEWKPGTEFKAKRDETLRSAK